ncbi:hypothetical protein EXE55_07065 [Burkholderia glumae]|uniref:NAD(P)-binding protein n=1 Tax=Burkholderia glumae TaxID=337 RepID=UPI00137463E1|nr:NAD(P)-binding protein [Burkholderia glumae]QHP90710.1 hypothetical protein EXE55_07065 [Burkholderia glumae]
MSTQISTRQAGGNSYAEVLPLLAVKVGPRQLDVNFRFSYISIRDQIIRAQMAVKALVETGLLKAGATNNQLPNSAHFQLAIFGAGIAGVAAAMQAEKEGVRFILIEKGTFPSGVLSKTSERYVSTSMYEWPNVVFDTHTFPLRSPRLLGLDVSEWALNLLIGAPLKIGDFSTRFIDSVNEYIETWRTNAISGRDGNWLVENSSLSEDSKKSLAQLVSAPGSSMLAKQIDAGDAVPLSIETSVPSMTGVNSMSLDAEYLLYAVGYGKETRKFSPDKPAPDLRFNDFWDSDEIDSYQLGSTYGKPDVLIVGSGDGALQDALRCLFEKKEAAHALEIWNLIVGQRFGRDPRNLTERPELMTALQSLASYDGYTTVGTAWSGSAVAYRNLDAEFSKVAKFVSDKLGGLILDNMRPALRTDIRTITILTRDGYFSKAYALNRFLAHLIFQVLSTRGWPILSIACGDIIDIAPNTDKRGGTVYFRDGRPQQQYPVIILRGGLDRSTEQQVGLSGRDTGRMELGRIALPIVPVAPTAWKRTEVSALPTAISATVTAR